MGVAGLAALGLMLLFHADLRVADARMPDRFSLADGYALFIRGALGFLVIGAALGLTIPLDSGLDSITGPATIAPVLLYAAWYLRSRGVSFVSAFGLLPGRDRLVTLAWICLALVGLQLAGEALIGAALNALHLSSHWADGLQDDLIWGSWRLVAREAIDSSAMGAARRRSSVSRCSLPRAAIALQRGAGGRALGGRLCRRARLRRGGLRGGLLERRHLGGGVRADGKSLALHHRARRRQLRGHSAGRRPPPNLAGRR